jgi:GTP-binding protein YchF
MLRATVLARRRGCGIVGLPNIGKSTLFNAITGTQLAKTGNYPFCTIDANLAKASLYDERARALAKFTGAEKIVDVEIDVADVAGLIAGASKGEGLGNKFLNDIRPVNIVLHMLRCFECSKDGFDAPDPLSDIATIENELVLADIESLERRLVKFRSRKSGDAELVFARRVHEHLSDGRSARTVKAAAKEEAAWLRDMQLLSAKPQLFVLNVDEESVVNGNSFSRAVEAKVGAGSVVRVCSLIEEQTAMFSRADRMEFLSEYGITDPAADQLLRKVYDMLDLQTFFTAGPKMVHGWAIPRGTTAQQAAGEIHGDFAKHFVRGKTMQWDRFVTFRSCKEAEHALGAVVAKDALVDGDVFVVEHHAR